MESEASPRRLLWPAAILTVVVGGALLATGGTLPGDDGVGRIMSILAWVVIGIMWTAIAALWLLGQFGGESSKAAPERKAGR